MPWWYSSSHYASLARHRVRATRLTGRRGTARRFAPPEMSEQAIWARPIAPQSMLSLVGYDSGVVAVIQHLSEMGAWIELGRVDITSLQREDAPNGRMA